MDSRVKRKNCIRIDRKDQNARPSFIKLSNALIYSPHSFDIVKQFLNLLALLKKKLSCPTDPARSEAIKR